MISSIPTWGEMLSDGFANIYTNPPLVLWPALVIALVCICLTLLANAMRDVLGAQRNGRPASEASRRPSGSDPGRSRRAHPEDDHRSGERLGEVLLEVTDLAVGYDQPDGVASRRSSTTSRLPCAAARSTA